MHQAEHAAPHTLGNLPCVLVSGPGWVHPLVMTLVMLLLMILGPRLSGAWQAQKV